MSDFQVKMNPVVKDKWIERLESDEIPQTFGALQRVEDLYEGPNKDELDAPKGFCCLGVLCEIAVEEGIIPAPDLTPAGYREDFAVAYEGAVSYLPLVVAEWAGIDTNGKYFTNEGNKYWLAADNDSGKTFPEIAQIIKENL